MQKQSTRQAREERPLHSPDFASSWPRSRQGLSPERLPSPASGAKGHLPQSSSPSFLETYSKYVFQSVASPASYLDTSPPTDQKSLLIGMLRAASQSMAKWEFLRGKGRAGPSARLCIHAARARLCVHTARASGPILVPHPRGMIRTLL